MAKIGIMLSIILMLQWQNKSMELSQNTIQSNIHKQKVVKIELVLNQKFVYRDDLKNISGKIIELDKSKIDAFMKDFDTKTTCRAKWVSCSAIHIWFKSGKRKSYVCNGHNLEDSEGNEFILNENIIDKYWGIKSEDLCLKE